jgi:pimeloyl-ACP methyl ester carboxylesterase
MVVAITVLALVFLAVAAGVLLHLSPGTPGPLMDDHGEPIAGSLSEKIYAEINCTRQGMIIQSSNPVENPVLLFLHGGPGMPQFFLNTTHPTGIERNFTVVWGEQRGAGLSFSPDIAPVSMTLDQMIADTVAVADYLRPRFRQDKIILLGHSWGSFLGVHVAQRAPDRFLAYVGMAQITRQLRSEVAAHAYLLKAYSARGDTTTVRKLEAAPVSLTEGFSENWMRLRDEAMHRAGVGTTRDMDSVTTGVLLPVWRCKAYTLREKTNLWRGKPWSRQFFWDMVLHTNLADRVNRLALPVYFIEGRHDYTSNISLARDYFSELDAPMKGFTPSITLLTARSLKSPRGRTKYCSKMS